MNLQYSPLELHNHAGSCYQPRIPEYFNAACKVGHQPACYVACCAVGPPGAREFQPSAWSQNNRQARSFILIFILILVVLFWQCIKNDHKGPSIKYYPHEDFFEIIKQTDRQIGHQHQLAYKVACCCAVGLPGNRYYNEIPGNSSRPPRVKTASRHFHP